MKTKVLFVLAFFLIIGFHSSAQTVVEKEEVVEISKLKTLMVLDFTLEFYPKFNNYSLIYRDYQYTQIDDYKSISLGNKENVLKLKNIILDFMGKSDKELEVELENGLRLNFRKSMGMIRTYVIGGQGLIGELQVVNKNKIEKLFPSETFN